MRNLESITADLDSLSHSDFDNWNVGANSWERLAVLCDELLIINDAASCAPVLFHTMERLDGTDLGSPGPIVHTLEKWRGHYETLLIESLRRKPTPLSVWMANRILNAQPENSQFWLKLLQNVINHPGASKQTKLDAQHFTNYQTKK